MGIAGYFAVNQKIALPVFAPSPNPSPSPTTIPIPTPTPSPTPTSTPTPKPTLTPKPSPTPTLSNSADLDTAQFDVVNFPEQACPKPEGRYYTRRYVYVRTQVYGSINDPKATMVTTVRIPGSNIDTARPMTNKVQNKLELQAPNTLIEAYAYEIHIFPPLSGANSEENEVIRCFNLTS